MLKKSSSTSVSPDYALAVMNNSLTKMLNGVSVLGEEGLEHPHGHLDPLAITSPGRGASAGVAGVSAGSVHLGDTVEDHLVVYGSWEDPLQV